MVRQKKVVVTGVTSEQAEAAFSEYAAADAKVQNIQSKMDIEITRIRESMPTSWQSSKVSGKRTLKLCRRLPPNIGKNCFPNAKATKARMACLVSVQALQN